MGGLFLLPSPSLPFLSELPFCFPQVHHGGPQRLVRTGSVLGTVLRSPPLPPSPLPSSSLPFDLWTVVICLNFYFFLISGLMNLRRDPQSCL
jgi:hypothetical protein